MKKIVLGILIILVIVVIAFIYSEYSKKHNSYSTPEEALGNLEDPIFPVLEVIDTKIYGNVAYVLFYSTVGESPDSYLAAGRINKNDYGWSFHEIIGIGNIDKDNLGMAAGKGDYIVGFVQKDVDKVMFETKEADMIL
ncbi:hypothetical protein V1502_10695 [Bacillus sp. SCS-153A]|uniref:hypothetical protein n=1 Tax=Rossellomorea sedimentorum TaxID=3115294 RepID=UPI0039061F1A